MPVYPSPKRRNFEKLDRDVQAGAWRISALRDPITEKHYRLFSYRSRGTVTFSPAVFVYRTEAARLIGGTRCLKVASTTIENDRVEILSPWIDLVALDRIDADDAAALFDAVLRALALFEKHSFYATELFPETLGRDISGEWVILPPAYAAPIRPDQRALAGIRRSSGVAGGAVADGLEVASDTDRAKHHAVLFGEFVSRYCRSLSLPPRDGGAPIRDRLLRTAESIHRAEISSIGAVYATLFGVPLPPESLPPEPAAETLVFSQSQTSSIERVIDRASEEGSVTVIEGPSQSGKSAVLAESARRLRERQDFEVIVLDEWDLYAKFRPKGAHAGRLPSANRPAPHCVWMIDDIDEKSLASSEFSSSMIESESFPKGSAVFTVQSERVSGATSEFLARIKAQRGAAYEKIHLDGEGEDGLVRLARSVGERVAGKTGGTAGPTLTDAVDGLLRILPSEDRQFLEFLSVGRFALPVEIVLSVFPETEHKIAYAAHRLLALDLLEQDYRPASARGAHTLFFRLKSAGLRQFVYDRVTESRRTTLHRTLALAAEETGLYPAYCLLYHALRARDVNLAARHLVKYLRETKSERRDPFVVTLFPDLVAGRVVDSLPVGDRILVCYELSQDLFRAGKAAEAERLLASCEEIMDSAEMDQKLKSAPLLASSLRLLADWLERRGEYKRALELLDAVKFELQTALSIPEQARLLNDIGWLQYRLGDYDGSMESCRLSLNTLNPNQYPLIVAQALNLMGVVHYNSSRYDEAISYYEQSGHLRERAGDENAAAASFNNLALAYQAKAEYEKALEYYNRSMKLKRRQNNQPGIAAAYLNLASLYVDMRNFKEAEAKCRESLAVCQMLDDVHAQAIPGNYMTLGDIAVEQGDLDVASRHYRQSLETAKKMGAINEEMGAYRRLSSVALKEKRFDEAKRCAEKAFELVQRIGSKFENAQIEEILGDVELEQRRQAEALRHYEKAAGQFTSLSKYRLAVKVLSKIGLIHAEAGNTFEARHNLDRARDYVRADIGHELPEEYNTLQRLLRGHTPRAQFNLPETQKIMLAFDELSVLADYAGDPAGFFGKLGDAIKEILSPNGFIISLAAPGGRMVTVDPSGAHRVVRDAALISLFDKTLSRGGLLDSRSPDLTGVSLDTELAGDNSFVSVPLKAMGRDAGCLVLFVDRDRVPLTKQDTNLFNWVGRQIATSTLLMLQLNPMFLKDEDPRAQGREAPSDSESRQRFENLIGKSEPMKKIFRTLDKIKETDSGILILGESGTGKSALARAIHYRSPRRNRPFREIHCAQIPYSLIESELFGHERGAFTGATQRKVGLCETADGGTLFLDDINVVPNEIQAKLLRFIETKTFVRLGGTTDQAADVRIVAASNEDLEALCRAGRFREDLYFRLKVILIDLPPLRERPEDTIAIALDYLKRSCTEKGIALKTLSPETIHLLQKAAWRGNVRELQNVLERVVVLSEDTIITPESLPEDFLREATGTGRVSQKHLDELVEEIIKLGGYSEASPLLPMLEALIAQKMVDHIGGKGQAAQLLGISKPTLYARLKDYEKLQ
jgi:DNA-binding NtrC family response regulator/tetratricopeptide (TPR) repeat protein